MGKEKVRKEGEDRQVFGRQRKAALFPAAPRRADLPRDSGAILNEIKRRTQQERLRVVMAANSAMVLCIGILGK